MHPIIFAIPADAPTLIRMVLLGTAAIGFAVALGRALRSPSRQRTIVEFLVVGLLGLTGWLTPESLGNRETQVQSFGLLFAVAWVGSWLVAKRQANHSGMSPWANDWVLVVTGLTGLGMARVAYIIADTRLLNHPTEWLSASSGGLLGWGGILGVVAAALITARRDGYLAARQRLDLVGLCLGWFITAAGLGCYLTGCDYGRPLPAQAPWWLVRLGTFPRWESPLLPLGTGAPSWVEQVRVGKIPFARTEALPVHPTQLYEALLGLGLCVLALYLNGRRRFPGELGMAVLAGYAAAGTLLDLSFADTTSAAAPQAWVTHLLRGLAMLVAVALTLRWSKAEASRATVT